MPSAAEMLEPGAFCVLELGTKHVDPLLRAGRALVVLLTGRVHNLGSRRRELAPNPDEPPWRMAQLVGEPLHIEAARVQQLGDLRGSKQARERLGAGGRRL